jgi:hypothetical protein
MIHMNTNSLHLVLTGAHACVTIASVVMSIIFVIYALGVGCDNNDCRSMVYITNTFFSTNKVGSLSGWAVATERAQLGEVVQYPAEKDAFIFPHFYECMSSAQMANKLCGGDISVAAYTVCLRNDTAPLGALAALTACNTLSTSFSQPWPSAEEYLQCLFSYDVMRNTESIRGSQNVFRACVAKSMWPFFEVQQGLETPLFLGSFNWLILLTVGFLSMTSFAVYTASPIEQGMVKKGEPQYQMRLGTLWVFISTVWLFTFFVLFLVLAVNNSSFEGNWGVPTTLSTSVVTLSVLGICFFYFLSELVESKDFEFTVHAYHFMRRHGGEGMDKARRAYDNVSKHGKIIFGKPKTDCALGTAMPNPGLEKYTIDDKGVAEYYTPPLLAAWADGYLPDACIFLGAAGATGQLSTDNAWHIFTLVLFYRGLNMMIARFMYQCFMNNLAFGEVDGFKYNEQNHKIVTYPSEMFKAMSSNNKENNKERPNKAGYRRLKASVAEVDDEGGELVVIEAPKPGSPQPHINVQVMALSAQIAAIYILAALCFLVFNSNLALSDFSLFSWFFICGFLGPELVRIIIHLICQIYEPSPGSVPWNLLNASMFVWTWDLATRLIFISIIFFSDAGYPGTRLFLVQKSAALLDQYIPMLS